MNSALGTTRRATLLPGATPYLKEKHEVSVVDIGSALFMFIFIFTIRSSFVCVVCHALHDRVYALLESTNAGINLGNREGQRIKQHRENALLNLPAALCGARPSERRSRVHAENPRKVNR